jgi:hippurate hydrolase
VLPDSLTIIPEVMKQAGLYTIGHIANGYITKRWGFGDGWDLLKNHIHEGGGLKSAELVGDAGVVRDPPLIMASEDFSFMLEAVPGCFINIGNGDVDGACEVHNPAYDFNDAALPLGASFFVRVVERKLAA